MHENHLIVIMRYQRMMTNVLRIPIKFKAEIDAKDLREYLLAHERMKPAVFEITAEHAPYLEFRNWTRAPILVW